MRRCLPSLLFTFYSSNLRLGISMTSQSCSKRCLLIPPIKSLHIHYQSSVWDNPNGELNPKERLLRGGRFSRKYGTIWYCRLMFRGRNISRERAAWIFRGLCGEGFANENNRKTVGPLVFPIIVGGTWQKSPLWGLATGLSSIREVNCCFKKDTYIGSLLLLFETFLPTFLHFFHFLLVLFQLKTKMQWNSHEETI